MFSKDDTRNLAEADHSRATKSGEPRSSKDLPKDRLGVLKRRLIQQPDWAAVAVARPLEINFTSVEEVGRVAKRRKLTDLDRERLSAHHRNPNLPGSFMPYKRKLPSSESVDLGHVKIRIDGRLAGSPSDDTRALPTNNTSSYSMLLESEPPVFSQLDGQASSPVLPWKVSPGRRSLQPTTHNRAPPHLKEPDIPTKTPVANNSNLAGYSPLQAVASKVTLANSSHNRSGVETDWGTSIAADYPLKRRHFTIDDQLLEEQMQFNITSEPPQQPRPRSSCSFRQTPSPTPTLIMADVSSERMVSSWLPQPQRMSQPNIPLNPRNSFTNRIKNLQPTIDEAPCSSLSSTSLEATGFSARPMSVKVFGQVVQL